MTQTRIIKRYANRKLYDTQHSRYVTLEQISEMIRAGDDVKIIDNKSKQDMTSVTLAQIIFEEEKKQRSFLPLQAMRNIIQNGGESFAQWVSEAQRRVTSMLPLRKEDEDGGEAGSGLESLDGQAVAVANASGDAATQAGIDASTSSADNAVNLQAFLAWIQEMQHMAKEWEKRFSDHYYALATNLPPLSGLQDEVKALTANLMSLESKLGTLSHSPMVAQTDDIAVEIENEPALPLHTENVATPAVGTVIVQDDHKSHQEVS